MKNDNLPDYTPPPPPKAPNIGDGESARNSHRPDTSIPYKGYNDPIENTNDIVINKYGLLLTYLVLVLLIGICCLKVNQLQDKIEYMETDYQILLQVCNGEQ